MLSRAGLKPDGAGCCFLEEKPICLWHSKLTKSFKTPPPAKQPGPYISNTTTANNLWLDYWWSWFLHFYILNHNVTQATEQPMRVIIPILPLSFFLLQPSPCQTSSPFLFLLFLFSLAPTFFGLTVGFLEYNHETGGNTVTLISFGGGGSGRSPSRS